MRWLISGAAEEEAKGGEGGQMGGMGEGVGGRRGGGEGSARKRIGQRHTKGGRMTAASVHASTSSAQYAALLGRGLHGQHGSEVCTIHYTMYHTLYSCTIHCTRPSRRATSALIL
jgi:hypothetical protein